MGSQPISPRKGVWLVVMLSFFAVLASLLVFFAQGRLFWCDELLLVSLVEAVPTSIIVGALRKAADGGFPLPYFIFSFWSAFAGHTELFWRVPSIISGLLTAFVIYCGARALLARQPALFVATIASFGSTLFLRHASEVRFYSLCYLGAAGTWVALLKLCDSRCQSKGVYWVIICFVLAVANVLLVLSHQLGILYSVLLFVAFAIVIRKDSFFRTLLAASAGAPGWILFFAYLPIAFEQKNNLLGDSAFRNQPSVMDLAKVYLQLIPGFSYEGFPDGSWLIVVTILLTLLLWGVIVWRGVVPSARGFFPSVEAFPGRSYIAWSSVALLSVPAGLWTLAHVGPSLVLSRYLMPSQLAFIGIFIIAFLEPARFLKNQIAGYVAGVFVVAWSWTGALALPVRDVALAYTFPSTASSLPVISLSLAEFYFVSRYHPSQRIYYLLDDQVAQVNAKAFRYAIYEQSIQRARRDLGVTSRIVSREELSVIGNELMVSAYNVDTIDYFKRAGINGFQAFESENGNLLIRRDSEN